MFMTVMIWILAIGSFLLWGYNFTYLFHGQIYRWFDNKFGKDDPMPPMPSEFGQNKTDHIR